MSLCGYVQLQMDRTRSRWLIAVTRACTAWADAGARRCAAWGSTGNMLLRIAAPVCQAAFFVAKVLCLLFANVVSLIWIAITYVTLLPCRLFLRQRRKPDQIQHVFVIMLENRAFDHMLGLSGIEGIDVVSGEPTTIDGLNATNNSNTDANGNVYVAQAPADWAMPFDPGHEFADVEEQLCGAGGTYSAIKKKMSGFVTRYSHADPAHPGEIMKCYAPEQLPVLTTLAKEFAVCDRWFSSMPGPTWPNRFFVHAASSGGLDDSPQAFNLASSAFLNGYKFDNGTIYDQLDDDDLDWMIYKGDLFPQTLAISGMDFNLLRGRFKDFDDFSGDVSNPNYAPSYVFIEPNYGHTITHGADFKCGDSQHPKDDVTRGERLLKAIYEAIRNSPLWESSLLVITYDEHGGFYDHVFPPAAVAPGDSVTDPESNRHNFDFKLLGARVPAVIVSPLIPRGTIDHTVYDHTSVLATIENIFGLQPLTERDKHANTFKHLLSLKTPRTDAPTRLPDPPDSGIRCEEGLLATPFLPPAEANAPVDSSLKGFLHVAFLRDMRISPPEEQEQQKAKYLSIRTKGQALQYMEEVRHKAAAYEAVNVKKY